MSKFDKIFFSYTLKGEFLSIELLSRLCDEIIDDCLPYIDIIHNNSVNKQERVEKELISSDYLILIKTSNIFESQWVKKELDIAKENNIPIVEIDYEELVLNKFQPITMYIKNRRDSSKLKGCSPLQPLCNLIEKCDEVAYFSYT